MRSLIYLSDSVGKVIFLNFHQHKRLLVIGLVVVIYLIYLLPNAASSNVVSNPKLVKSQDVKISIMGDVMLGSTVGSVARKRGVGYLMSGISPILKADDLSICNLESAVTDGGTAANKKYVFRASPSIIPGLKNSGIEAVSIANNHSYDYGKNAFLQTLSVLHRAGLTVVGGGITSDDAFTVRQIQTKQGSIGLIAASTVIPAAYWAANKHHPGIADAHNTNRLIKEIKSATKNTDILIIFFHWGIESNSMPNALQRGLARKCIDAGADMVVGTHPHVLQGFEYYRGKFIAYSMGNFVFYNQRRDSLMLQASVYQGKLQSVKVIPCEIMRYKPIIASPTVASRIIRKLRKLSFHSNISKDGNIIASNTKLQIARANGDKYVRTNSK